MGVCFGEVKKEPVNNKLLQSNKIFPYGRWNDNSFQMEHIHYTAPRVLSASILYVRRKNQLRNAWKASCLAGTIVSPSESRDASQLCDPAPNNKLPTEK